MKAQFNKLFTLLTILTLAVGQAWGAYYTPTADEVVIIKDNMSDATNGYGTSTHGAFSFAAEITSSNKQMGSASLPIPDGSGNATYSTYKLKGNGGVKNMTITIAGCSKLIIYNKSHSSRYIVAEITPDGESMYTENGSANTTSTEITLDGTKSYSIWVYGYDGSNKQDIEVYAFKLIKATGGGDPVDVTGISISPSPAAVKVGKTITLAATITPNNATDKTVTWSIKSGSTYASVDASTGVVTGLAEGTAVITATANDGSGVTEDVTVNVSTCPTSGTMYKFQVATGLTDGNLTSSVPQDVVMTTENYLSFLTGGTLTGAARANVNRIKIVNGSAIGFANGADAYLEMHLDCDIEAGDIIKYTIASNNMELMAGSPTESTNKMTLDRTKTQVEVDSKLVGASALYMKRSSSSPNISYFEIYRPVYRTITLEYADGATADGSLEVIDGNAAVKPADPTWEHHRFDGWYNGASPYDWSATVSGDLTLTAHWTQLYTVTYAANGGSGEMTDANEYAAGDAVTLKANEFGAPDVNHVWDSWAVTDGSDNPVAVSEGKFNMPSSNATVTAQWALISDFDVKFYQGYGEPDVQIGTTQSISTGNYAIAPTDPVRAGYRFLGWSYDATVAHIVNVSEYAITVATDFTAMWIQQFAVTFDGAGEVLVDKGAPVASPNSPVTAGKVFQGWYNGESKYDFTTAVTGNLALTSKWADADANHYTYAYNDDFHFDGVVYKTPDGKTKDPEAAEASNVALETNPYTLFSGTAGITSIIATNGIYDYKKAAGTKHITAYLKLKADDATSNVVFTIASGYTAVLKLKMNGYSSNATISLKKGDDAVTPSGTQEGTAEGKNYGELTYNLTAGEYKLTTANKTLYISHIDLEATALPTFTVTYKAGDGTGDDVVDADATNVADVPGSFTAPEGKIFNGWKDGEDNDVAVGAIVTASMTLTAQWINHYAVTFNMNGHGDAIDPQDIKHGAKAAKPADPTAADYDFGGWFTDVDCTAGNEFDFNTAIVAATPLYAKWTVDPCLSSERKSLSKVVLSKPSDYVATVTGYNSEEYAGSAVIGGLGEAQAAEVDPSHEGTETGYKLSSGGSAIVFATLKKGTFQEGDRVVVTITKKQDAYKVAEVAQPILDIYYGTSKDDATFLATIDDVTAAGSYTYRLTAADITAIGTKTGIGVFRPSSGRTQNPYVYSVEIQGCRSWSIFHTLTFKNIDGTVDVATPALEEGAYASTVAPAAPKIAMKRFLGWSESVGGALVDLTSYTITADATLYAVYEDIVCPTNGTVYKFVIKDELPSENLPTSTDKDMSSYITATGEGYLTYTATANNKATINSDGTIQMKDATAAYLKVELECTLTAGDQIRSNISNNPMRVQVATTFDADDDLILAKNVYNTVDITSAMVGKNVLYIARSTNGNANIADFEIYRPAKYDVSFNMMGHGSAIADLEDVVEGSKIVAPDPAPTDVDYSFAGWYKENTLENEWDFDNDVVNAATTLYAKWLDKSDATLKSLKYGDEDITLVDGIYTYNISLPAFTSAVPALTAVPNNPNATAVPTNAAAFDGEGNATSTVLVTPESGTPQTYTVNFSKGVEVTLQDVTGSITWDFANAVSANVSITNTPQVLANYGGVTNDATFESDKLEASGEKFTAGSKANLRAKTIHFRTTVPGMLSISYSNTGGSNPARYIYVNGVKYDNDGSANTTPKGIDNKVFVPAGDVYLEMKDGEDAPQNIQVYKIIFNDQANYTRNVTEGRYGTICLPNGGVMVGAELYEVAYYGATSQKIFLDQIPSGEMVAGRPYIFLPNEGASQLGVFYTDAANADAGSHNGLIGSYTKEPIAANVGNYILLNNQYCPVESTVDPVYVGANKAYIKLSDITPVAPALKPGAKRVGLGVAAPQTPTDIDNLNATDAPVKVMINGQMYIIRGEKMYNANGQLVK